MSSRVNSHDVARAAKVSRAVVSAVVNGKADRYGYEAPLTSFGRNAVDRFFTADEIKENVALTEHVAA